MDPIISFVIGGVIVFSTYGLLKESLKLTLDGIPKDIDSTKVKKIISDHPHVKDVHHVHIWALSSTENALTAHICLNNDNFSSADVMKIKREIKHQMEHEKIQHVTLEVDSNLKECDAPGC